MQFDLLEQNFGISWVVMSWGLPFTRAEYLDHVDYDCHRLGTQQ